MGFSAAEGFQLTNFLHAGRASAAALADPSVRQCRRASGWLSGERCMHQRTTREPHSGGPADTIKINVNYYRGIQD
eukprot:COSAG01_NODE_551_length_15579_cov_30.915181_12_plen_76_part_00